LKTNEFTATVHRLRIDLLGSIAPPFLLSAEVDINVSAPRRVMQLNLPSAVVQVAILCDTFTPNAALNW